jgi:hypothetical protein
MWRDGRTCCIMAATSILAAEVGESATPAEPLNPKSSLRGGSHLGRQQG